MDGLIWAYKQNRDASADFHSQKLQEDKIAKFLNNNNCIGQSSLLFTPSAVYPLIDCFSILKLLEKCSEKKKEKEKREKKKTDE